MAPERVRGAKPSAASDMYSLGVILLLTHCPQLIPAVEGRSPPAALTVAAALDQAVAQLDVDFPGLLPLLRRLTSEQASERCKITELRQQAFFCNMAIPSHWADVRETPAGGPSRLRAVRLRSGTDDGGGDDDDTPTLRALQGALETEDPAWLGVGADATQWPPSIAPAERRLELAAAWRVQHPGMWARYSAALDQAFHDVRRGPALPPTKVRASLGVFMIRAEAVTDIPLRFC
jgi:hypothetical protein